jgi:hypothetical protein
MIFWQIFRRIARAPRDFTRGSYLDGNAIYASAARATGSRQAEIVPLRTRGTSIAQRFQPPFCFLVQSNQLSRCCLCSALSPGCCGELVWRDEASRWPMFRAVSLLCLSLMIGCLSQWTVIYAVNEAVRYSPPLTRCFCILSGPTTSEEG